MTADQIINLIAEVLLFLPLIGIISSGFLWYVWYQDENRPRSWVLALLAIGATLAAIVSIVVAILAAVRLSGQSLGTVGGVVLTIAVLANELIPLLFALVIFLKRRGMSFPPFRN